MHRILVTEDDDSLREVLLTVLSAAKFAPVGVRSMEEALDVLPKQGFSCILSDFRLPKGNGLDLLAETRKILPSIPFVLMTAFGSIEIAVQAMKQGATDFITKPFDPSKLCDMLREVLEHKRIISRGSHSHSVASEAILSKSGSFIQVLEFARKLSSVDTPVLITGESGTGKEVLARYIHNEGNRREKPFIGVNCGAIPKELLESEFFGHEAGSFTGATQARPGLFEIAGDGTIFLDEVAEMPVQMQVKLLRALQEKEVRRVGGNKVTPIHARIISATNQDTEKSISAGTLREDFYYRLAVVTLGLPALRERKEDIDKLAQSFIELQAAKSGKKGIRLGDDAREFLRAYPWPGNIRELENVVERATILADSVIQPEHLGIRVSLDLQAIEEAALTLPQITERAVRQAEMAAISRALELTQGNKSQAAKLLGVSYKTLLAKVKDYGLGEDGDESSSSVNPRQEWIKTDIHGPKWIGKC